MAVSESRLPRKLPREPVGTVDQEHFRATEGKKSTLLEISGEPCIQKWLKNLSLYDWQQAHIFDCRSKTIIIIPKHVNQISGVHDLA